MGRAPHMVVCYWYNVVGEAGFRELSLSLWESEVLFCPVGDLGPISGRLSLNSGLQGSVHEGSWAMVWVKHSCRWKSLIRFLSG